MGLRTSSRKQQLCVETSPLKLVCLNPGSQCIACHISWLVVAQRNGGWKDGWWFICNGGCDHFAIIVASFGSFILCGDET